MRILPLSVTDSMMTKSDNAVKSVLRFLVYGAYGCEWNIKRKEVKRCRYDIKFAMIIHCVFLFDTYLTFYV